MAENLGYVSPTNAAYKDPVTVGKFQQIYDNFSAIVALLNQYKQGISIGIATSGTLQAETGSLVIGGKLRTNVTTSTIGWGNTGGNGIAETSSTGYYIWAVASGATSTFEFAINQTSSNMTGNANSRLVGWFWNDTGNNIEGAWYFDKSNNKKYESAWRNISKATSYVFNHNLNKKPHNHSLYYVTGTDPTSITMIFNSPLADYGTTIQNITDTTFQITTELNGVSMGLLATGTSFGIVSGYAKITIDTI